MSRIFFVLIGLVLTGPAMLLSADGEKASPPPASPWQPVDANTEATLRGLSAAGDGVVWVTGSEGTVRRTVDGGKTWTSPAPAGSAAFEIRDVEAWSGDVAVLQVAGQPARFYRTVDGGKSYAVAYEHKSEKAFFDGFAFWPADDRRRGIAYSDPVDGQFLVAITDDAGASWTNVDGSLLPAPRDGEAGFAASGSGIAVAGKASAWIGMGGPSARILRTMDGGKTWSFAETPLRSGSPSSGVFSVAFRTPERGLAVGGDYRDEEGLEGTLAQTSDGGATWAKGEGLSGYRSSVVWVPSWPGRTGGAWLAAGPSGVDVSFDDGKTWSVFGDQGWHVLSVGPDGEVWAAGSEGRVARLRLASPAPGTENKP